MLKRLTSKLEQRSENVEIPWNIAVARIPWGLRLRLWWWFGRDLAQRRLGLRRLIVLG